MPLSSLLQQGSYDGAFLLKELTDVLSFIYMAVIWLVIQFRQLQADTEPSSIAFDNESDGSSSKFITGCILHLCLSWI
jgi:hypothetical protein